METPKTMKGILNKGESVRVAFESSDSDRGVLGRTICAFLNSGGGQIVVGVDAHGRCEGNVSAVDVENMLRPLFKGSDALGMITPNAVWDVSDEQVDGGHVAIIDVPGGGDLPYVFQDSIYIRTGKKSHLATGGQTRSLIEKRYLLGARWERQPALNVTLSDLDEKEIFETAKIASNKRGWQFTDSSDPLMILEDLNLVDQGRLTHAAVVLFAKEAGHILPQTQVRLTAYNTDKNGSSFSEDRVARGHLFGNLEEYEAFVKRHVSVISELSASNPVREDSPTFPYWALREGFRNAVMHRDYSSYHGRASISLYPQRVDIWNFGELPQGLDIRSLKNVDRSLPVNPDIAQVLFLRGLVELLGRGTRKIVEEFRAQGLQEPKWERQAGGISLKMHGGNISGKLPEELNIRQIDLLRRMRPGHSTSISDVFKSAEVSERTVRNDLTGLVKLGFFARQGQGKGTFYIRTEKPIV